jgi:DNA polymerase III subunit gamma/tau
MARWCIPLVEEVAQQPSRDPQQPSRDPQPPQQSAPQPPEAPRQAPEAATPSLGLVDARRIWPDLLEKVREMRRYTWILLSQNAQVVGLDGNVLTVGFKNAGARDSFLGGGSEEILRQAAIDVIGADWKVEAIVDPSADPGAGTAPRVTRPASESSQPSASEQAPAPEPLARPSAQPEAIATARSNIAPTRTGERPERPADDRDADVDRDDPDADDSGIEGAELLQRELGATVIDEIPHH